MTENIFYTGIKASVIIKSSLRINDLADIISEKLFLGLPFIGLEKKIYDEVPAIFIDGDFFGCNIILSGNQGLDDEYGYCLEVRSKFKKKGVKRKTVDLSTYFSELLIEKVFRDDIIIK